MPFTIETIPKRVQDRFWVRVAVGSPDICWLWRLSCGSHGYGQIGWWDENRRSRMVLAHRLAWELSNGPIPGDLTVDHLCRVRRCCNPAHLRLLTNADNASLNGQSQRVVCPAGHPYDEANTYVDRNGHRRCNACRRARYAKRAL